MKHFTTAELRGFQQLCFSDGTMIAIACDQRNAMRALLADTAEARAEITMDDLGVVKSDIVQYLGAHASSVLLDPVCAVPDVVRKGILPRDVGLILGLDASGYDIDASGYRLSRLAEGFSARHLRELGATAGKIMVYLRADRPDANAHNLSILQRCIADFASEDLLLVVEFLTYPLEEEKDTDYARRLPELVEGGVALCLEAGAKLLKIPYPGSADGCARVHKMANGVPWTILSAGVDHADFLKQVDVAVASGAMGVIAGRALWKDCISRDSSVTRHRMEETAVQRLAEIRAVIAQARSRHVPPAPIRD